MTTIYDIAEGDSLFVQVGSDGLIETNPDPSDPANAWTARTSGTLKHLYGVAWNGAVFVVVGQDGIALVSADGVTWTTISSGVATDLNDVASGGNVFIAVGNAGVIISSQNGYSWTPIVSGTTYNLWGVVIANAVYTAVGDFSTIVVGAVLSTQLDVILSESVAYSEALLAPGSSFNTVNTEVAQMDEGSGGGLSGTDSYAVRFATSAENLTVVQSQVISTGLTPVITDTAAMTARAWQPFADLTDAFTMNEVAELIWNILPVVTEAMTMNDDVLVAEVAQIIEAITVAETLGSDGSIYNTNIAEDVSIVAILRFAWGILETEDFTVADLGTPQIQIARALAETLVVSGVLPNQIIANDVIAIAIALNDVTEKFFERSATDSVGMNAAINNLWLAVVEALETVEVSESAVDTMIATFIVSDSVALDDTITINQILNDLLTDGFNFTVSFTEDGESYTGWVMNAESFAVSKYIDYNFNSMCRFNGEYLAASASGVYQLAGDDDDGTDIDSIIKTRVMSFGTHNLKRVKDAYVGVKSNGTMLLKTISDRKERWYELKPTNATHKHGVHAKLGRGVKSVYWQFELVNVAGADFQIQDIELLPVILSRKV